MKTTKKKMAFTAFLTALISLGIFIPIFWINNNASPLGTFIHAQFVCDQSDLPIVGLDVTIGLETHTTDVDGKVVFGSGFGPGTYTIEWTWWDKIHTVDITIDCSTQDWYLQPYPTRLPNPEVHKTFLIELHGGLYIPAEGLDVTLVGYGIKTTDAKGYVAWIVDYPFADTTLEWTWNGVPATEDVLWTDFVEGVWTGENVLKPKSGGGNLYLPEELG